MKDRIVKWLSVALLAALSTANLQGQSAELIALWEFEQLEADGETIVSHDGQWRGIVTGDAVISPRGTPRRR